MARIFFSSVALRRHPEVLEALVPAASLAAGNRFRHHYFGRFFRSRLYGFSRLFISGTLFLRLCFLQPGTAFGAEIIGRRVHMTAFGAFYHRILFGAALDAEQGIVRQFAAALFAFLGHNHSPSV